MQTHLDKESDPQALQPPETSSGSWGEVQPQSAPAESLSRRIQRGLARSLRLLPQSFVKPFAAPYIAGERLDQGVARARQIYEKDGLESTLDVLGEDVRNSDDVQRYHEEYRRLVDAIAELPYANISIKLSALGQLLDEADCIERTADIVARARAVDTFVRIDMEDHTTTNSTLDIYQLLRDRGFDNLGVVLQSRLFRTKDDIQKLAELRTNVRLCIGIYREPAKLALQDKDEMKRHMLELLEVMWRNHQHVGLATHEEWCVRDALRLAERLGKPAQEIEVQMLLGVPRGSLQRELVAQGITVRLYVPYGEQWYAYSMRRLENNPDVFVSILKSMVHTIFRRG